VVSYLKNNQPVLKNIQNQIKQISDLERLISKLLPAKYRRVKWFYLKESLDAIIPIKTLALESPQEAVKVMGDSLHSCELLREKSKPF
jgi:DNA mismatch repair protein MutS